MTYHLVTENVPPIDAQYSTRARYPFNEMKAGQMVHFDAPADMRKINRAAHQVGMNHGWKFAVRRQTDGSIRVWRLA
jgi:hypothetical protein